MANYRDTDGYTTHTKPMLDEWFIGFSYPKTLVASISIKKVIFNDPATIVLWADGTKTVVKCADFDIFDPEKGLAMAICKRVYGERFHSVFKEFLPEEDPKIPLATCFDDIRRVFGNVTININTNTNSKEDK